MFTAKQESLIEKKKTSEPVSTNPFVKAAQTEGKKQAAQTLSGNHAVKYSTTGNNFVDQFGLLGTYKNPRTYQEVEKDSKVLWEENPVLAVCFILYIRLITRVVNLFNGNKTKTVQRGAGLRTEGILRMIWLHVNYPETFWKNINLFLVAGSWKDIFEMLSYDLQYNGWKGRLLDWDKFALLILAGLENPKQSNLVKKYLPQLRSNNKCTTLPAQADNLIAKWLCAKLFGEKESSKSYKQYRKLKTSGTAHQWQQLISKGKFLEINFDTIHGRALAQIVSSKFLANHKLEDVYDKWIQSKPVAKFTGFAPELFVKFPTKKYQIDTLNKQFNTLIETVQKNAANTTRFITVVDTSGSMDSQAAGIKLPNIQVAMSLAVFFSYMFKNGPFAGAWYNFSSTAHMVVLKGKTPFDRFNEGMEERLCCSTNFQAVVDHFIKTAKGADLPESELPNGFLVLSDGEFNQHNTITNTEGALVKLRAAFSKEFVDGFKFVYWNLASHAYGNTAGRKFETYGDTKNVFYFSGYDGSSMAFLTGVEGQEDKTPTTAQELFKAAMSQELMGYVEV